MDFCNAPVFLLYRAHYKCFYDDDDDDEEITSNDTTKTEILNSFFSSVFVKEENTNFTPHENVKNVISMEKLVINELDILKRLDKIDNNKSPGPDGIHSRILYEERHIADALKIIFINSLQNHVVPVDWRAGNISPIFKKGKKLMHPTIGPLV